MIINASENRLYSIDLIKIVTPPPPLPQPSHDQFKLPQESEEDQKPPQDFEREPQESEGEEKSPQDLEEDQKPPQDLERDERLPHESEGDENVTDEKEKEPNPGKPPPLEIPSPRLYSNLMYLNLSSNYLFSLYGIQCCPQLKVHSFFFDCLTYHSSLLSSALLPVTI